MSCVSRSLFFFFKQKTAYEMRISDWSSDVCSSDLARRRPLVLPHRRPGDPAEPDAEGAVRQRRRLFLLGAEDGAAGGAGTGRGTDRLDRRRGVPDRKSVV